MTTSYADVEAQCEAALATARAARGTDLATIISRKAWSKKLRNRGDLEAFVDAIDVMVREQPTFFERLYDAADKPENALGGKRGRERPKKADQAAAQHKADSSEP